MGLLNKPLLFNKHVSTSTSTPPPRSIYVFYVCIKYQTYQKSYYLKCHQIDKVIGILMKPRMQNQNFDFLKIALNRVLTLPDYRSRRELLGSSGIIDFENNRVCKQFKHWNYRISVPMSILTLHKIKLVMNNSEGSKINKNKTTTTLL